MDLESQYNLALSIAKQSECTRRKYGVVIAGSEDSSESVIVGDVAGYNKRIGRCCDGNICVRDRYEVQNGERVELGAEIHAEQMALVNQKFRPFNAKFIIAGLTAKNEPLYGTISFPCHVCALMIAYAGYKYVYLAMEPGVIEAVNIWDIIEYRESEWESRYDV